jgi:hypothetical protein
MIRSAHSVFQSYAAVASVQVVLLCLLLALPALLVPPLHATAIATGSIQVTKFAITPASGTVAFGTLWTAQSFAQAQNSLCACDSQFNSSLGGTAQADAMVMFAQAQALTDASTLTLTASDAVNITRGVMAANTVGQNNLFNTTFSITGGTGPVDVTFSALVKTAQSLFTDASGVFAMDDTSFQLTIDGQTLLFMDTSNQIGPSSSVSASFSDTLSDTITLDFDQTYSLDAYAQDDPSGYTLPEPASGSLFLMGGVLLGARRIFMTFRA